MVKHFFPKNPANLKDSIVRKRNNVAAKDVLWEHAVPKSSEEEECKVLYYLNYFLRPAGPTRGEKNGNSVGSIRSKYYTIFMHEPM